MRIPNAVLILCSVLTTLWIGCEKKDRAAQGNESEPVVVGIGVFLTIEDGAAKVASVVPDGPAAISEEVNQDDTIVAVAEGDGVSATIKGMALADIVQLIRGRPGSEIWLTITPADDRVVKRKVVSLIRSPLDLTEFSAQFYTSAFIGKKAPEVTFTLLSDSSQFRLSDFAGKVVVLDFWATWCAPCQKALAALQQYRETYQAWGEKVALITISRDEEKSAAMAHLQDKGWDKTLNLWGDQTAADTLGIRVLPTVLVVDQEGNVVAFGNPNVMDIPRIVNALLNKEE